MMPRMRSATRISIRVKPRPRARREGRAGSVVTGSLTRGRGADRGRGRGVSARRAGCSWCFACAVLPMLRRAQRAAETSRSRRPGAPAPCSSRCRRCTLDGGRAHGPIDVRAARDAHGGAHEPRRAGRSDWTWCWHRPDIPEPPRASCSGTACRSNGCRSAICGPRSRCCPVSWLSPSLFTIRRTCVRRLRAIHWAMVLSRK